jgi:hypothetical protein
MSFSALESAWLFALLIPLIIFYFLKLKRPRQMVSSLVLWRQVLSDQRVNSPFQRFKRNLLLLLQILLLALLALAAMQPFLRRENQRSDRLPILVDVSASMGALDKEGGRSRLDEARGRLRERIDALLPDQELCVIAFGKTARKLTGFTNNKSELRDAVSALEVEDVPGQLDDALQLAQAIGRTEPFDRVLVLTDGHLPRRMTFDLPFTLDLQKLPAAGPNTGIVACQARRSRAGDWEVFVQLAVTDPAPASTATLTLSSGENEIARDPITLTASATPRLAFKVSGSVNDWLRIQLETPGFDSLAADNLAWLALPVSRPLDIFVPEKLAAFRHALAAMEGVRVYPANNVPSPSTYDLLIVDEPTPASATLTCTVGIVPDEVKALVSIEKASSAAVDWRRDAPLLEHVSFNDVIFLESPTGAIGADEVAFGNLGYEILVHGPKGPLMLSRIDEAGGSGKVHLLFHPDRSTMPYRVGFPILVRNLVSLSEKLAGLREAAAIGTGVLPPQTAIPGAAVEVRGPAGFRWNDTAGGNGIISGIPATKTGEYILTAGSRVSQVGASLLNPEETGLATVDEIEFGDRVSVVAGTARIKSDRSLWWLLAAAGFGLLLTEWWWFQRRPF